MGFAILVSPQAVIAVASGLSPEAVNVLSVTAGSVLVPVSPHTPPPHRIICFIHCDTSAAIRVLQGKSIESGSVDTTVCASMVIAARVVCAGRYTHRVPALCIHTGEQLATLHNVVNWGGGRDFHRVNLLQ